MQRGEEMTRETRGRRARLVFALASLLLIALIVVASLQLSAQDMLVGSYNIRYKNRNDSVQGEQWAKRCQVICDQVNFMAPLRLHRHRT